LKEHCKLASSSGQVFLGGQYLRRHESFEVFLGGQYLRNHKSFEIFLGRQYLRSHKSFEIFPSQTKDPSDNPQHGYGSTSVLAQQSSCDFSAAQY
jgi:hypothetical protein